MIRPDNHEEYASWNRLRRDLGWDSLDQLI